MHYGQLYDERVADTYDEDSLGLLSGTRSLAINQILQANPASHSAILDLGVGTGETLRALAPSFAEARMIGIDLSERMIEIAQRKISFEAHVDDACNAGAHVAAGSIDLTLAHFLTSFVHRPTLFAAARQTLKTGGLFSVVSTPHAAFGKLRKLAGALLGDAAIDAAAPAPTAEQLESEVAGAGFEILAFETFRKQLKFRTFDEAADWGIKSGFLAQSIEAVGLDRVRPLARIPGVFPISDEYVGIALLARAT